MSFMRILLLTLSLALAWAAHFVLQRLSLAGIYPDWLLARLPQLTYSTLWLPRDLLTAGVWMLLLASLLFGLAVPTWIGISSRRLEVQLHTPGQRKPGNLPFLLTIVAILALALVVAATIPQPDVQAISGWVRALLWLGALALAFAGAALAARGRTHRVVGDDGGTPERSWILLLFVMAAAAFLFSWESARLPSSIPAQGFLIGLQAEGVRLLLHEGPLALGSAGLPHLATLLTSATVTLARNPLNGLTWSGMAAGLALVAATWLLGCELFRRTRLYDGDGEVIDDDGRGPALWMAMAVAATLPVLHHARLPLLLEPVVWGVLGLWAQLRGIRRGRYGWVVAGAIATGLAVVTYGSGLLFVVTGLLTWLGISLVRRRWLVSQLGGVGWKGALLWTATVAAALSPSLCIWACGTESPISQWIAGWNQTSAGLRSAVEALGLSLDTIPDAQGSMLVAYGLVLAPILLLGFAGMVFQLDQIIGWVGVGWLLAGIAAAAPITDPATRSVVLLGALPGAALAIAFGLDRSRATLTRIFGGWINGTAMLLASGLVVLATLAAWQTYPTVAGPQPDSTSALARAIAFTAADAQSPLILITDGISPTWEDPALQLAVREEGNLPLRLTLPVADMSLWPADLPAQARVFVAPQSSDMLPLLGARYPGGSFRVRRDIRSNPIVYIYQMP